jgi:hypothetical protein
VNDLSSPGLASPGVRTRVWPLLLCVPVAIIAAVVPLLNVRAQAAPWWLAIAAAVLVFPLLPLGWHLLGERSRLIVDAGGLTALDRLALRTLAVGALVLAVSLANLGPRRVGGDLTAFVPRDKAAAPVKASKDYPAGRPTHHELESFIPADATLVMAVADPRLVQQFLVADSTDTRKTFDALAKCQIALDHALVLVATRDRNTRLVVFRAPGITEQRNLYCLVGVLGKDHLNLRITGDAGGPLRFEVDGLLARTLRFEAVDDSTVIASDGGWGTKPEERLFAQGDAKGPLAAAIERVDRGAGLWSAGVAASNGGLWDVALDGQLDGSRLKLRSSSVPPSGTGDQADLTMSMPIEFMTALPSGAIKGGVRAMVSAIAAVGAGGWRGVKPPETPPQ